MAIFIANLSFSDPSRIDLAKLAVILGSVMAALIGLFLLRDRTDIVVVPAEEIVKHEA
jgi:NhaA family Na+:H+ antiporter